MEDKMGAKKESSIPQEGGARRRMMRQEERTSMCFSTMCHRMTRQERRENTSCRMTGQERWMIMCHRGTRQEGGKCTGGTKTRQEGNMNT